MPVYEVRSRYPCPHPLEHVALFIEAASPASLRADFPAYDGNGGWLIIELGVVDLAGAVAFCQGLTTAAQRHKEAVHEHGKAIEGARGQGPSAPGAIVERSTG